MTIILFAISLFAFLGLLKLDIKIHGRISQPKKVKVQLFCLGLMLCQVFDEEFPFAVIGSILMIGCEVIVFFALRERDKKLHKQVESDIAQFRRDHDEHMKRLEEKLRLIQKKDDDS